MSGINYLARSVTLIVAEHFRQTRVQIGHDPWNDQSRSPEYAKTALVRNQTLHRNPTKAMSGDLPLNQPQPVCDWQLREALAGCSTAAHQSGSPAFSRCRGIASQRALLAV